MTVRLIPLGREQVPELHRIKRLSEIADRLPIVTTLAEVEEWVDSPSLVLELDGRIAVDGDVVVGYCLVGHTPSGERLERAHLDGEVDPAHRGSGVGSALLSWALDRATARLSAHVNDLPRYIRTERYLHETAAAALYERHGMVAVRWGEELIRPLEVLPPLKEVDGVVFVPCGREHAEALNDVHNEAFADHWGSTPWTLEFCRRFLGETSTRVDLSFLALDGEQVVGYVLNSHYPDDTELNGRSDGWIENLGVRRAHRGRGIASRLIGQSLHAFSGAGMTHGMIGVDQDNPSGAAHLYRRLGFAPLHRSVIHQIEVVDGRLVRPT